MRYLRKFNESLSDQDELREFLIDNLAPLLDGGGQLVISFNKSKTFFIIRINYISRTWGEIKDDFITFFTMLDIKYDIVNFSGKSIEFSFIYDAKGHHTHIKFTTKDLIDDLIPDHMDILSGEFYVKVKS